MTTLLAIIGAWTLISLAFGSVYAFTLWRFNARKFARTNPPDEPAATPTVAGTFFDPKHETRGDRSNPFRAPVSSVRSFHENNNA